MKNIILSSTCALYNTSREDNRETYMSMMFKKCFLWLEISTLFCLKAESGKNITYQCSENTVLIQGLHVKCIEALTVKTNTSNVYTVS